MESRRALFEIEGDAQYFVSEVTCMRCVLVSWHFSTCASIISELQKFSRRSGGHSRRIPGVLRTTNHQPLTHALICHEPGHRSKAHSPKLEFFFALRYFNETSTKLKHILIRGPNIRWSQLLWGTPSNATPCFHMLSFTVRHLPCLT